MSDNVELIWTVAELGGLFEKSSSLDDFLQQVTERIARHMQAEVCSIYLLDPETNELVMRANTGLNPSARGQIHLHLGEGLTGLALRELRAINVPRASRHPFYKFFPDSREDLFESFLAVPVARGLERLGVLVLQKREGDEFAQKDVLALRVVAAQMAQTIENAKMLIRLHGDEEQAVRPERGEEVAEALRFLKGKPACGGIAIGKAAVLDAAGLESFLEDMPQKAEQTRDDFFAALKKTETQIEALQTEIEERLDDVAASIFSAHLLILRDEAFCGAIEKAIDSGLPVRDAVVKVAGDYIELFGKSPNPRFREKVHDIKDLGHRLLHNLMSPEDEQAADYSGHIIIASEIMPSEVLRAAAQHAEGIILLSGGVSAHVSILARSMELPMIVPDEPRLLDVEEGTEVVMDADQGTIYVEPGEEVRQHYIELIGARRQAEESLEVRPETVTADGVRVHLLANINLLSELHGALRMKAEGIGLYRSEFPFLIRDDFPLEEEQLRIYRKIVAQMEGREVTFRTLDIGGDKMLSYYSHVSENNPFLGLRAIRFSFQNPGIFKEQLRAMLRAAEGADLRIMFPMVASVDDFTDAREVVHECLHDLQSEGTACNPAVRLGAMIELPSAVEVVDELAQQVDFMSIGTNDLIQYLLAVDRTNEHVAGYYIAHHPAVLRAIARVADAARRHKTDLSVCGEMAMDPRLIPFLLGLGVRKLSLNVRAIPGVQQVVSGLTMPQAEAEAAELLQMGRIREVDAFLEQRHAVSV
jgi:phosphotransferase system enzyme I (PtsP)